MKTNEIPPGAKVWVEMPPYQHHGVYLGDGDIAHLSKKHKSVRVDSIADFREGRNLYYAAPSEPHDVGALRTAVEKKSKALYSLLSYNCESFANDVLGRAPRSRQAVAGTFAASAAGVYALKKGLSVGQTLGLMALAAAGGVVLANAFNGEARQQHVTGDA